MGRIAEALKRAQQERAQRMDGGSTAVLEPGGESFSGVEPSRTAVSVPLPPGPAGRTPTLNIPSPPKPFPHQAPPVEAASIGPEVLTFHDPTSGIAEKYLDLGLEIIATSPPLPGFVLVANKRTVPEATRAKIRDALLSLNPKENAADRQVTRLWGKKIRYGAVPAADEDYNVIRDMLEKTQIPEQ